MTPSPTAILTIHVPAGFGEELRRVAFQARGDRSTLARFLLERALLDLAALPSGQTPSRLRSSQIDPLPSELFNCPLAELFEQELRHQARTRKLGFAELARALLIAALEPDAGQAAAAEELSATVGAVIPISSRDSWLCLFAQTIATDFEPFEERTRLPRLLSIQERRALEDASSGSSRSGDARRI